jgi:hypothetical protein
MAADGAFAGSSVWCPPPSLTFSFTFNAPKPDSEADG